MKQKIAIMLLLSTALGALASCGGADDSSEPAADETTASGEPQEITLSADSDYVIVCDEQGLESERKAAEQLAAYLEKITGRRYSIVDDDTAPADHEIIVGKTSREGSVYQLDRGELETDELCVFTSGNRVIALGEGTRGTLYAVYELLEQIGCRFYATGVETVPQQESITLPAGLSVAEKPAFEYRDIFQTCTYDNETAVKLRLNGGLLVGGIVGRKLADEWGGGITYAGDAFVHTFDWFVPLETYADSHPEYFSMINGERNTEKLHTQLCLTNEEVYKLVLDGVREWLSKSPDSKIISVSQNDSLVLDSYCTCPSCQAIIDEEGSAMGPLLRFVNRIAEDIKADYPDVYVDTLAYQYSVKPCKITKPADNVIIRYCTGICCAHGVSGQNKKCANKEAVANIRNWSREKSKLYIWDYTVNFANYLTPYPNIRAVAESIKFYATKEVSGVFMQGMYQDGESGEFGELRAYVMSKLMWDPSLDVEELISDFMAAYYGAAAEQMTDYLDSLSAALKKTDKDWYLVDPAQMYKDVLTEDDITRLDGLWTAAENATEGTDAYDRVRRSEIQWRYYKYLAGVCEFAPDASGTSVENAYAKLLEDCHELGVTRLSESSLLADG